MASASTQVEDAGGEDSDESLVEVVTRAKKVYIKRSEFEQQERSSKEWKPDARTLRQQTRHETRHNVKAGITPRETETTTKSPGQRKSVRFVEVSSDDESLSSLSTLSSLDEDDFEDVEPEEPKEPPKRSKAPRKVSAPKRHKVSRKNARRVFTKSPSPFLRIPSMRFKTPPITQAPTTTTPSTRNYLPDPPPPMRAFPEDLGFEDTSLDSNDPRLPGLIKKLQSLQRDLLEEYGHCLEPGYLQRLKKKKPASKREEELKVFRATKRKYVGEKILIGQCLVRAYRKRALTYPPNMIEAAGECLASMVTELLVDTATHKLLGSEKAHELPFINFPNGNGLGTLTEALAYVPGEQLSDEDYKAHWIVST